MVKKRNFLWIVGVVLIVTAILLTACGGNRDTGATTTSGGDTGGSANVAVGEPAVATLTPQERFPESLVIHPDAFDFEITEATSTYVYVVPMMVAETVAYLEENLKATGWEELGKPMIMGHLATLNLQREGFRLNVSMQDNERSQTTRVQMLLNKK